MVDRLHELIERAEGWPEEARERLISAAEEIERDLIGVYVLSAEELKDVEEGLEDIRQGRIASGAETEAFFARCR
jgi:hypothetical protein